MNKKETPAAKREKHMKDARMWLRCLREGTYPYRLYVQLLREEVKDGRFMLEDIGTSEAELGELCVKGAEVAAKVWLEHIKKDPGHPACTRFLVQEIKRGKLTPADIGTTLEELNTLAPMAAAIISNR